LAKHQSLAHYSMAKHQSLAHYNIG
jgi:hypothetical protein